MELFLLFLDCYAMSQSVTRKLGLGEWHYHPSGGNEPSGLDIKSLTEIAAQNEYRTDKPIMILSYHRHWNMRLQSMTKLADVHNYL